MMTNRKKTCFLEMFAKSLKEHIEHHNGGMCLKLDWSPPVANPSGCTILEGHRFHNDYQDKIQEVYRELLGVLCSCNSGLNICEMEEL